MTYRIVRHIGRGGMADVFLAVQNGPDGFEKLVVLKRMFPALASRPEFERMFFDEARYASSIRHPNVVQLLDVGLDDGMYIAMEYLSGETLDYVFNELRRRGDGPMPYPVACCIAADIADGLHSAHTSADAKGNQRRIIHRDVSPSNLLVCYTGIAKVLDFGIAKAQLDLEQSPPESFCGKLAYAAPEQVNGDSVDPRTDVFQLGIVLHELLTGRHLFAADTDHATLMAAVHRPIAAPSELNPSVPPELDAIVLSALQRGARFRTESAALLGEQLRDVLRGYGHYVGHGKVATWMRRCFADRRAERKAQERKARIDSRQRVPKATPPPLFPDPLPRDEYPTLPTLAIGYRAKRGGRRRLRARVVTGGARAVAGAFGLGGLVAADARPVPDDE